MKERATPKDYLTWGVSLLVVKYLGEAVMYYFGVQTAHYPEIFTGGPYLMPWNFLSPMLKDRYLNFGQLPDWFAPAVMVWSIPFIWIGAGMSIRRAADAGRSPWWGTLFFVPGLNFVLMAALAYLPSSDKDTWSARQSNLEKSKALSPMLMTVVFALFGAILTWFSTNVLKQYGSSLFIAAPLVLGSAQGFYLNSRQPIGWLKTAGYCALTILWVHLALLIFALEGVICLAMSFPIAVVLAMIGSQFGAAIARLSHAGPLSPAMFVFAFPLLPIAESQLPITHRDVVVSVIEVNVPPEKVFPNVVKFSDLPKSNDWLFQLGVAHPLRARIDGEGVGAVRHCEFTTGAFVEPITAWESPHRLAFDVRYQPQPMKELSIYDSVDAPHLDGYFRSVKGEFRLVPLPGGRTRLEGRTWYEMDINPGWYWQIYGRWFIHKIHGHVLSHVKNLSESQTL